MTSRNLLYLRKGELIVGQKVADTNAAIEPQNALQIKTRLNFTVEKDESGNANKAKINIYNLSEDTKTFLERDNLVVFLNAGYAGGISNLFFGDLQRFDEKRNGPDIITTLECGDAENILREANIQIGLGKNATNIQVINQAIAKLKLSKGFQATIPEIKFANGYSFSGQVKTLLNEMMEMVNLKWSIQNGELQILGETQSDFQTAVLLNQNSGLIGTPTKSKDGVEFISLLNPEIRPGRAVVLESKRFLNGSGATVKVNKTVFTGDTHEGAWQVKCEGVIQQ